MQEKTTSLIPRQPCRRMWISDCLLSHPTSFYDTQEDRKCSYSYSARRRGLTLACPAPVAMLKGSARLPGLSVRGGESVNHVGLFPPILFPAILHKINSANKTKYALEAASARVETFSINQHQQNIQIVKYYH